MYSFDFRRKVMKYVRRARGSNPETRHVRIDVVFLGPPGEGGNCQCDIITPCSPSLALSSSDRHRKQRPFCYQKHPPRKTRVVALARWRWASLPSRISKCSLRSCYQCSKREYKVSIFFKDLAKGEEWVLLNSRMAFTKIFNVQC